MVELRLHAKAGSFLAIHLSKALLLAASGGWGAWAGVTVRRTGALKTCDGVALRVQSVVGPFMSVSLTVRGWPTERLSVSPFMGLSIITGGAAQPLSRPGPTRAAATRAVRANEGK